MATNGRVNAAPPAGLTPGSRPGGAEGISGGSRSKAMPPSSGRSRSSRSGGSGSSRSGQPPPPPPSSSRSQHPTSGQRRPSSGGGAAVAASSSDTTEANRLKQQTPFICNIRFKNDLPEVPGHPKLLISRLNEEEASKFKLSSLEKQLRRGLLLPSDLGITISPLDINRFSVPPGERQPLDPEDEDLLADDAGAGPEARQAATKQEVSWLMRTTYIANDSDRVRPSDKRAAEQLAAPSGQDQDQDQEMDRDAQIWAIEAGFEAAKRFDANPVNPKNPSLRPVSILPVLPDMDLWGWDFAFAKFDTDPFEDYSQLNKQEAKKKSWLKAQSVLKVFQAGEEKIISLIIPKEFPEDLPDLPSESHKGLLSGTTEGPKWHQGDWRWLREYSFELHAKRGRGKQKRSKTSEVLLFQDDKVTYLDLPVSLTLNKRRRLDKQDEMMDIKSKRRAQVLLEDRELTEAEQLAHQGKVDALYGMQMEPHADGEAA